MDTTNTITSRAEALRQQTIALLDNLAAQAKECELPLLPTALEQSHRKLAENTYKVLVVGEAKRGKSTFVNAVIGRDILPTDVDIATSQVFHVQQAEREAYHLRFEDDSAQEISHADLLRYGSQVVADMEGTPQLAQLVRWIEVDVPIRFLPRGVAILDTPGLGALYAAHAQITQRFVPHADAVIFVLDSERPIGQAELAFVETLLGVTRNLFFIQTKIDQYSREHWQGMQQRNQEILVEQFTDRLVDTRVWPISSTNLRKAAVTDKDAEAYVMVSRHKELAVALQAFLFRVAGWSRTAEAMALAEHYHIGARQTLATRLAQLVEESSQKRAEWQQQASARQQQFEAEWGERGQKRRELGEGIRRLIELGKRDFSQALQPNGDIALLQEAQIEAVQSIAAANHLGATISGEVVAAVTARWRQVCEQVQSQCVALLGPFVEATDALHVPSDSSPPGLVVRDRPSQAFTNNLWTNFKGSYRELMPAAALAGIAALIPPLAPFASLAVLWSLVRGWRAAGQEQVRAAQQELRKHFAGILQQVRRQFFDVQLASGRLSQVDEYFHAFERTMLDQLHTIVQQKSEEARAELARVVEASKLDGQQRKATAERLQQQMTGWEELGAAINRIMAHLKVVEEHGTVPMVAGR